MIRLFVFIVDHISYKHITIQLCFVDYVGGSMTLYSKIPKTKTKLSRVEVNSVATPPLLCKHDKASTILALTSRYGQAQYVME